MSYPCRWSTCNVYLTAPGYCSAHAHHGRRQRRERNRLYDRYARNREAAVFYHSPAWKRARLLKLTLDPLCERCRRVLANTVHHKKPFVDCTAAEALDLDNLQSVCPPCHNEVEAQMKAKQ